MRLLHQRKPSRMNTRGRGERVVWFLLWPVAALLGLIIHRLPRSEGENDPY